MEIEKKIKELVEYAKIHLYLCEEDEIYFTNLLLKYFGLEKPYEGEVDIDHLASLPYPDEILEPIKEYLMKEKGLEEGEAERECVYLIGLLSPRPSEVDMVFSSLHENKPESATSYLYDLSIKNNYIAKSKVDKNIIWDAYYEDGSPLEISINLSKPEKNNKDIAKLVKAKASTGYPKCVLCEQNIGFAGHEKHPARENLRFIPLTLDGERWFMQYSPYVYYDRHCIVFHKDHIPMAVNRHILNCLCDFVDAFPHFFIGSNSDLPIVGGSILNHEHFQGGAHLLPLLKAKSKKVYFKKEGLTLSKVDFYDTCLKIEGKKRNEILDLGEKIINKWKTYDDLENEIIHESDGERHSTTTAIIRKENDVYQLFLILRNNRCNEAHPDGIFHAHKEYHHIKHEGIGLIEAAGLFILPPRLVRQCKEVEEALNMGKEEYLEKYPDLIDFERMITLMKKNNWTSREYINDVCKNILKNVAVFKDDSKGNKGLDRFIEAVLDE